MNVQGIQSNGGGSSVGGEGGEGTRILGLFECDLIRHPNQTVICYTSVWFVSKFE